MGSEIIFLSTVAMVMSMRLASTPLPPASPKEIVKCTKGNDCPMDKCCVFDPNMGNGVCQPMLTTADVCYTSQPYAWSRPEEMITDFDSCPCESGDFCVPLDGGELGICSYG